MGKRGVSERVREKEKDWRYRLTFVSKYAQGVSVCVYVCAYGCKCVEEQSTGGRRRNNL